MPQPPVTASGTAIPRIGRRAFLQAGSLGFLELGLPQLTAWRAQAGVTPRPRARAVVFLFLSGGLAQHESFDMKPDAPREIRGEFQPIRTRTPGLHICEHLPRLARLSNKWSLVRSLTHPHNEHSAGHHAILTGHTDLPPGFQPNRPMGTDWPSLAALAGDLLPPRSELPASVVLPDKIVHRTGRTIPGQFAGQLGSHKDPWFLQMSPFHPEHYGAFPAYLFHHAKGAQQEASLRFQTPQLELPREVSLDRLRSRIGLRDSIERQANELDRVAGGVGFDRYREAAVSLLTQDRVKRAFSLDQVDPKWLDRYGRHSFGWSLLMARQLVEAGVGLVQVNLGNNETWDTHQAAWPNLKNFLLPPMDQAVGAFLEDLDSRGLLRETLVVLAGEFGRTPEISTLRGARLPGRDHWGAAQSVLLAGGGVEGGRVVGSTDKIGAYPAESPQKPENLAATVFHALGLPADLEWHDPLNRPHPLYQGDPIPGL